MFSCYRQCKPLFSVFMHDKPAANSSIFHRSLGRLELGAQVLTCQLRRLRLLHICFFAEIMSLEMSKKAVSAEEFEMMKQLMARLNQFGLQSNDPAGSASHEVPGAMNDASKRLRETEDELWTHSEYDGSSWSLPESMLPPNHGPQINQLPVMPKAADEKVSLPAGVSCLEEWGNTLCELPAVAPLKKSYAELADDPDQRSYLMWVIQHESKKGPRVEDLAKYLKCAKYSEKHVGGKTSGAIIPGTNILRKFK